MSDIRYALRQLLKNPGLTVVAVLTLAVGIGASASIFSALDAILLRPLPYKNPEQLVWILANSHHLGYPRLPPNWANELFSELMERSQCFEQWARVKGKSFILQKSDGAEHIRGMRVTARLFTMLGVQPLLGRTFLPDEIWEPESLTAAEKQSRAVLDLIIARLRPRVTYRQAKSETELLFQNL